MTEITFRDDVFDKVKDLKNALAYGIDAYYEGDVKTFKESIGALPWSMLSRLIHETIANSISTSVGIYYKREMADDLFAVICNSHNQHWHSITGFNFLIAVHKFDPEHFLELISRLESKFKELYIPEVLIRHCCISEMVENSNLDSLIDDLVIFKNFNLNYKKLNLTVTLLKNTSTYERFRKLKVYKGLVYNINRKNPH